MMTEDQWLACEDPLAMLRYLQRNGSTRKQRLYAVAAFGRVPELQGAEWDDIIRNAERHAEGLAEEHDVAPFRKLCFDLPPQTRAARSLLQLDAHAAACDGFGWVCRMKRHFVGEISYGCPDELAPQAALLRDIFGNPFRPVALDPSWRTSTAVALARQMYESRDFGAMPILADALQDAGCDSAAVLDHCRSDAPHVRGCWVVDLLLGKG